MRNMLRKTLAAWAMLIVMSTPAGLTASPGHLKTTGEFNCWYLGEYSTSYEDRWNVWYCDEGYGGQWWVIYIPI